MEAYYHSILIVTMKRGAGLDREGSIPSADMHCSAPTQAISERANCRAPSLASSEIADLGCSWRLPSVGKPNLACLIRVKLLLYSTLAMTWSLCSS